VGGFYGEMSKSVDQLAKTAARQGAERQRIDHIWGGHGLAPGRTRKQAQKYFWQGALVLARRCSLN
jgi:hypothetical protein